MKKFIAFFILIIMLSSNASAAFMYELGGYGIYIDIEKDWIFAARDDDMVYHPSNYCGGEFGNDLGKATEKNILSYFESENNIDASALIYHFDDAIEYHLLMFQTQVVVQIDDEFRKIGDFDSYTEEELFELATIMFEPNNDLDVDIYTTNGTNYIGALAINTTTELPIMCYMTVSDNMMFVIRTMAFPLTTDEAGDEDIIPFVEILVDEAHCILDNTVLG